MKTELSLCRISKEEIAAKLPSGRREKAAFLSGLIFSCGSLLIHGEKMSVAIATNSDAIKKAIAELVGEEGRRCRVVKSGKRRELIIENATELLAECKVLSFEGGASVCGRIDADFLKGESAVAFIKGAYLGSGNLITGKYHLEFSFGSSNIANDLSALLAGFGIPSKLTVRGERAVVYTKDSDKISDCLTLMGAHKAMLGLNSLLAEREVREQVNRRRNCDLYNIDRQVETGLNQCAHIKTLNLRELSEPLREIAEARLNNPEASYEQLGAMLGISKSGAKNRLIRLMNKK